MSLFSVWIFGFFWAWLVMPLLIVNITSNSDVDDLLGLPSVWRKIKIIELLIVLLFSVIPLLNVFVPASVTILAIVAIFIKLWKKIPDKYDAVLNHSPFGDR